MLKNYIKTAWRNLLRNKVYSLINILGLSVGMTVAILIGLWIWDEVTYNKSFQNYDHVAMVMENSTNSGQVFSFNSLPIPLSVELRTKYGDDFKRVAMTSSNSSHTLAFGEKKLIKNGTYGQPDVTEIFSLKMLKGTRAGLNDPSSIMLSESLAKTIFGNADPMDKIIKIDNKTTLKVTGVYKDFPSNTEFRDMSYLMAWENYVATNSWVKRAQQDWDDNSWKLLVQLNDQSNVEKVSAKIKNTLTGHDRKDKPEAFLFPMSKWHLYSEFKNGKNAGGRIQFVWLFGIIGFFILMLACINFMNLSTARSEKRAKEVGIRKAIGSLRKQLVFQFLGESIMLASIALVFAVVLAQLLLPWFNQLADKQMNILWTNVFFWLLLIGFTLFTGFISGSYPALFLSAFNPVKVLKGTFKAGRLSALPRKILVILQFTISITLIIGTIIVFRQIIYAKNRPVGYTREGLISVEMNTPDLYGHYGSLRSDLINTGMVENMAESSSPTTDVWSNQSGFDWRGKDPNIVPSFAVIAVTHDFGKTVGWQFKEGRDFSRDLLSDSATMILNEAAEKYMGFQNAVGENVRRIYQPHPDHRVIGVIHNMVMQSPFDPVKPTIFLLDYEWANIITVKINPRVSIHEALPKIEAIFKKYNPGSPFEYKFADEEYAKKFTAEERIGKLATFFAILAVFISCLGLFGLASFVAEQRTKEIGVRKVLGASVINVWSLLSKDFLMLVLISFLIAVPVSIYIMHNWLDNYAYHTPISWLIFVIVGVGATLITLATVGFQAVKAALANPVKSLRSE